MDAEIPRYEVEGEGRVLEMPCDRDPGTVLPSLREIHEMRGAENSRDLRQCFLTCNQNSRATCF